MHINKRYIAVAFASLMGLTATFAQRIAVVSAEGKTSVSQTLQKAIENASEGSVIYLPGGGFELPDSVKITKKISIIGIGHVAKSNNADGNTVIGGNVYFNAKSSGSSVMGCYISGNVYIGYDGAAVHNIVVKYCNLNGVQIKGSNCTGTIVNQNYLRSSSSFGSAAATLTNNVISSVSGLTGGIVKNNIFKSSSSFSNCSISRNIFLGGQSIGSDCTSSENMNGGENPADLGELGWEQLFKKYNGGAVTPASDFQFADDYAEKYRRIGIYGGTGFNPNGQPPLPFFMARSVAGQTDASGNLNIKIRVQSGENK